MPIVRITWGNVSIQLLSLGLLCALSMFDFFFYMIVQLFTILWWSYGDNRVQVDADIKVLSEFLEYLQSDSVRGLPSISSLSLSRVSSTGGTTNFWKMSNQCFYNPLSDHAVRMHLPLRLLTKNEIFRLCVWNNPTNEVSKGSDLVGNTERTLFEARISIVLY